MSDFIYPTEYDVLVVGAGHAGIEAGVAAARLGCRTLVLTQNADTVGQMSCNPAIGGLAKGHMVREIDALGGFMGLNTDATGIQFRMLNSSKGPSVRAPRAQCDKKAYQFRAKVALEREPNLDLKQANVTKILTDGSGAVVGVETNFGLEFRAKTVVITTGTFMRGLMHVGLRNQTGGRMGDAVSTISDSLKDLGFEVGRFKTGTPCRLLARSIDFGVCDRQDGDETISPFSFLNHTLKRNAENQFTLNAQVNGEFHVEQVPCWITSTNEKTHNLIRANLDKSPMYCGIIEGTGPRYCPSIEDKVVRFAEKTSHQIFLEPEGRDTDEIYVNGVSTSLPYEVQYHFIRSIRGLENAEILRPGYAVEYDFCPPTQLHRSLETQRTPGLYFAGQINGTSGYEEAAAQGLMAGANAALKVLGREPFILSRSEAYIGVLIDDLVSNGAPEPYRMFTSRAEYRILLRQDNADQRLTPKAIEIGLVSQERELHFVEKMSQINRLRAEVPKMRYEGVPMELWLRRPSATYRQLPSEIRNLHGDSIWSLIEVDLKYAGYVGRQELQIQKASRQEAKRIPADFDYAELSGLRLEAVQKLREIRPETLGQASRVQGVTPADLSLLAVWLERRTRTEEAAKISPL